MARRNPYEGFDYEVEAFWPNTGQTVLTQVSKTLVKGQARLDQAVGSAVRSGHVVLVIDLATGVRTWESL